MNPTFGQRLKHFANAIDIVDENTYKKTIAIIEGYLRDVLNIQIVRTMVESRNPDGTMVLVKHKLDVLASNVFWQLTDREGRYKGQMPFAYAIKKPLWIISKEPNQELAAENVAYIDQWSNEETLPRYLSGGNEGIKTSIIIPIRNGENRVYGVANFETTDYLEVSELAKKELMRIAETISVLYQLLKTRAVQACSTNLVIDRLDESLKTGKFPKLTKPSIFLASPNEADSDVIAVILDVLAEFSDRMDYIFWRDMNGNGNINQKLLETIASCRYGICYFSQQIAKESPKYRDNPNVVFEAGMFHGRSGDLTGTPCGWLPVREKDSPPSPFDFSGERMVLVPRDGQERVLKDKFKVELRRHINGLLDED